MQTCRLNYKLAQLIDEKMLDAYLNETDVDWAFELCSELMSAKRDAAKLQVQCVEANANKWARIAHEKIDEIFVQSVIQQVL